MHDTTSVYIELINKSVKDEFTEVITKARVRNDEISHEIKEARNRHLDRFSHKKAEPLSSLIFVDMLNAYRRIKDHCLNIAEAAAGEK